MCTLSYIRTKTGTIITSIRDEKANRVELNAFDKRVYNNCTLYYAADPVAGGTWLAVKPNGTIFVLLNGGLENHVKKAGYKKSRGLVLLDIASTENWFNYDFTNIEPCTVIGFEEESITELVWTGTQALMRTLSKNEHHLWSSSTLYDATAKQKRQNDYNCFLDSSKELSAENVLRFFKSDHLDQQNGFLINRADGTQSVSITQIEITDTHIQVRHELTNQTKTTHKNILLENNFAYEQV